jgi:hypothetical protein
MDAYKLDPSASIGPHDVTACAILQACLLDNLHSSTNANMQSSTVLLGLTPSLMMLLAPTTGEIATLMASRPALASLLVTASPSFAGLFRSYDVKRLEDPKFSPSQLIHQVYVWFRGQDGDRLAKAVVSCLEYSIACAIFANAVENAVTLGRKGNVVWRCNSDFLPITWCLSGVIPAWLAAASLATRFLGPINQVAADQGRSWMSRFLSEFTLTYFSLMFRHGCRRREKRRLSLSFSA